MALKQLIVPLNDTVESLTAFRFVLRNFGFDKNVLNIIWLGKKHLYSEKSVDVNLHSAMIKLGVMNLQFQILIKDILENEFTDIKTNINVVTLGIFTKREFTDYCSYADILFSTFGVYLEHIYPLFKQSSTGKKTIKSCCPKILMSNHLESVDNIILVKTDQVNTISTVKQFCHVYNENCKGKELNVLDLQEFDNKRVRFGSQKMLVDYLKNHVTSPATYSYAEEGPDKLKTILNLNNNTVWVSPLESIEEVKFIIKKK